MAFLLSDILFETAGQGPPPSKDFYQFVITQKEVFRSILNDDSSESIIRDKYLPATQKKNTIVSRIWSAKRIVILNILSSVIIA